MLALVETGWFAAHTAVLNLVLSSETNAAQTRVQSLFNSNYLGQNLRLLQTAYIPAIGMGGWWTIYVLTLHTVWSISMSIALTEALFPDRETSPWLRRTGFIVTVLLFALGAILMTKITFKGDPFVATLRQFVGSALVCVLLGVLAFRLPKTSQGRSPQKVPSPWLVGGVALAASSGFMLVPPAWGWIAVATYLALDFVVIAVVCAWSRRSEWDGRHRLALAAGATLTYAWHSFPQKPVVPASATIDLICNTVFSLGTIFVIWMAARRANSTASNTQGSV